MNRRGSNNTRRGQMPMAMIAVALLISSTFFCIVTKNIEDSTDNADDLTNEADALDEEMVRTVLQIEADLGNIVSDLSQQPSPEDEDASAGSYNLIERSEQFDKRYKEMFASKYPSFNRGVRAEILSSDIGLTMETMKLGNEIGGFAETQSSFLRAVGTVTIDFSTESMNTVETFDIVADATSCLPLIIESATEFELSLEGGNSALAQMVDYQLTALAQSRIMNGYGVMNIGGEKSTVGIITEKDVLTAVRNALDILETMSFRANASGNTDLLEMSQIDIADYMVAKDGYIEFDLGAFYAQAIYSNLDKYVLSWLEYLGADVILDIVDSVNDIRYNVLTTLANFLLDKDIPAEDARNYIKYHMKEIGHEGDLSLGRCSATLMVWEMEFVVEIDDESVTIVTDYEYRDIGFPEGSILDWDGWGDFHRNYRDSTNVFKKTIESILKTIALNIRDSCVISIPLDCYDDEDFAETLRAELSYAIGSSNEIFKACANNCVNSSTVTDPYMATALEHVKANYFEIYRMGEFYNLMDASIRDMCRDIVSEHPELADRYDEVLAQAYQNCNAAGIREGYDEWVELRMGLLESMNSVTHKKNGLVINTLAHALGKVIDFVGIGSKIEKSMVDLVDMMIETMGNEPSFDVIELPEEDGFTLTGDEPGVYVEKMSVTDSMDLDVTLISPTQDSSKNIHYIGFSNWGDISFSANYGVRITGTVDYTVISKNVLSESLGAHDAMYVGSTDVDIQLDIPLISGWGLAGVKYQKSNTLINDVWLSIFNVIQPFLDDLMRILKTVKDMENFCSNIMLEFGNMINTMMNGIYELISIPLEILQNMLNTYFQSLMDNIGLESLCLKLGSQTLTLDVFGTKVTIDTNIRSLFKNTKEIVTISVTKEISGMIATAACTIKQKPSNEYCIIVKGSAEGDDWKFNLSFDPFMSTRPYYVGIDGNIRGIAYSGTMPELVQYKKLEMAISDVPGMGQVLSNIPTLIPGIKCAVDAGVYVKYGLPIKDGLLINEVELNPEGNDAGNEWVELYNNTDNEIDLTGYVLVPASGDKKSYSIEDVTIGPKEKVVITLPTQTLNNSGSKGHKGEMVSLYDTYGNLIDKTDWLTDSNDSEFTNQRACDGYVDWGYNIGSPGERNGDNIPGFMFNKAMFVSYLEDAVVEVMDDMGGEITTTEGLMTFIERVIARIIERIIETIADTIIEAYVFIELAFQDATGSLGTGLRVMVGLDSKIVSDTLRYIVSMIPMIGEHINNPTGMSAEKILMDDIYLRTVAYMGISTPSFMRALADVPQIEAGISLKINISAIATLLNVAPSNSQWSAEAGIVLEDVPTAMIPKAFDAYEYYDQDLWLFRMTFSKVMD